MQTSKRRNLVVPAVLLLLMVGLAMTRSPSHSEAVSSPEHRGTPALRPGSMSSGHTPIRTSGASVISGPLLNHGGPVQTAPVIYVVYWGWGTDPSGEQTYLNNFLSTVGGTSWLSTVTEYSGAGNPPSLYAGSWSDPSAVPAQPTDAQIQSEALAAVQHFGLGTSVNIEIIVATPTGHSTPGFGTSWCAYHGAIAAYPNVTYTNLPYMTDAGSVCGANTVIGPLDGVSIVEGHELAETITDPLINAWLDAGSNEIGDKCAWVGLAAITTSAGSFAVQPLWSNAANGCVLSPPPPPPLPPPVLSDTNGGEACPNDTLVWTSVPGATSYQIWGRELKPAIEPSFHQIWSGAVTYFPITLPRGYQFNYAATACNANGCSGLSNYRLVTGGTCR